MLKKLYTHAHAHTNSTTWHSTAQTFPFIEYTYTFKSVFNICAYADNLSLPPSLFTLAAAQCLFYFFRSFSPGESQFNICESFCNYYKLRRAEKSCSNNRKKINVKTTSQLLPKWNEMDFLFIFVYLFLNAFSLCELSQIYMQRLYVQIRIFFNVDFIFFALTDTYIYTPEKSAKHFSA